MENDLEEKNYIPNQVISKDSLKTYFENGDTPDEQDFWEWQDSYWHKNDPNDVIPSERLDLSGKADKNATNLDGENVQSWRTKLNIQDNVQSTPVSATESGIVNNEPLQELGGVDKTINKVRIGKGSGNTTVIIGDSTSVGDSALSSNTTGTNNTAIGMHVLRANTSGSFNTGLGDYALYSNATGVWNSALGSSALLNNTSGQRNVATGSALYWNTVGNRNTGIGFNAGFGNSTGQNNTYIGNQSGYNNGTGNYNVALGNASMIITGSGSNAGTANMNNNVFIGSNLKIDDGVNDTLAIDNKGATVTQATNALIYGGFALANRFVKINGALSTNPANTPNADGDTAFTKKVVAKADGTFGFATDVTPAITITSTSTTKIRLTSDFVSSIVTRANVPTFNFNVESGRFYKIKILGAYSTIAATTGGSIGFVLGNGATGNVFGSVKMNIVHTNTAAPEQVITAIDSNSATVRSFATSTGVGTVNTPEVIIAELIFECSAPGVFNVQWASEIANSNATLLKNTLLEVTEI